MAMIYSDRQIDQLLGESKQLPQDYEKRLHLHDKRMHKQGGLAVVGVNGHKFRLILRWNTINILDFSVILAVVPSGSKEMFRLCRYNGKHGEHTNKIEQETFYNFHIHTATERYQLLGAAEDSYAKPTDRYADFHGALDCMLADCGFIRPSGSMNSLFREEKSQ